MFTLDVPIKPSMKAAITKMLASKEYSKVLYERTPLLRRTIALRNVIMQIMQPNIEPISPKINSTLYGFYFGMYAGAKLGTAIGGGG